MVKLLMNMNTEGYQEDLERNWRRFLFPNSPVGLQICKLGI